MTTLRRPVTTTQVRGWPKSNKRSLCPLPTAERSQSGQSSDLTLRPPAGDRLAHDGARADDQAPPP